MSHKYVYLFTEGNGGMRELLGGKGANLAEMTNIGLPVPQGFTISTEACTKYYEDGRQINDDIKAEIMSYVDKLEEITGKKFGDHENPLLVSVRSGGIVKSLWKRNDYRCKITLFSVNITNLHKKMLCEILILFGQKMDC